MRLGGWDENARYHRADKGIRRPGVPMERSFAHGMAQALKAAAKRAFTQGLPGPITVIVSVALTRIQRHNKFALSR